MCPGEEWRGRRSPVAAVVTVPSEQLLKGIIRMATQGTEDKAHRP